MKLIIFDTEYLSLSRKLSNFNSLVKYKKKLFPEIIQISFLKISNIFLKNSKKKKLNIYIKIKQKIPRRIIKLTDITQKILNRKGLLFQDAIKSIDKFIENKTILIANGEDIRLLKFNINHYKIKSRKKKKIYYVNLKSIFKKISEKKNFDTQNLNKIFNFKINFKVHNASNDCIVIHRSIQKFFKLSGKQKFLKLIEENKKLVIF